MHRRDLLAAGSMSLVGIAGVLARTDQALADTDPQDLIGIEAAVEVYSHGYGGRAPAEVLQELVAEVERAAPQLTRRQSTASRKTLTHAIGQLGGLTAIVLHDLGRHREADDWFVTAAKAAKRSGVRQLHAWVLARRAMVPLNFGAPRTAGRIGSSSTSSTSE